MLQDVAIVSETEAVSARDLMRVAAAVQKQVLRDFGPIWGVEATVDPFGALEDVPIGYWPVIVRDDIGYQGAAGVHLDEDGQPFALVQSSDSWSLTASHEVLEMLADPFGNRLIAGDSIKSDQGRVQYLVEVCDPSEGESFGYTSNGILVSDFYTPSFFDPVTAAGVRYSYSGAITGPRQVLRGGYLSWNDPVTDHWWQATFFSGSAPSFRDLGVFSGQVRSLREEVDRRTPIKWQMKGLPKRNRMLAMARRKGEAAARSTGSRADRWHKQMARIRKQAGGR
jgi:hypothetical protein